MFQSQQYPEDAYCSVAEMSDDNENWTLWQLTQEALDSS